MVVNKTFFDLKIIDLEVKLHARNFIKIFRVEIIRHDHVEKNKNNKMK